MTSTPTIKFYLSPSLSSSSSKCISEYRVEWRGDWTKSLDLNQELFSILFPWPYLSLTAEERYREVSESFLGAGEGKERGKEKDLKLKGDPRGWKSCIQFGTSYFFRQKREWIIQPTLFFHLFILLFSFPHLFHSCTNFRPSFFFFVFSPFILFLIFTASLHFHSLFHHPVSHSWHHNVWDGWCLKQIQIPLILAGRHEKREERYYKNLPHLFMWFPSLLVLPFLHVLRTCLHGDATTYDSLLHSRSFPPRTCFILFLFLVTRMLLLWTLLYLMWLYSDLL